MKAPLELRPWTIPNLLTFGRLLALPFLLVAILEGRHRDALLIFLAASVTDVIDGYVARRFQMTSPLGAYLDPIADKLFLTSAFIVFSFRSTPSVLHVPTWLLVLTISRDVAILVVALVMFLALDVRAFPPSPLGKATTFLEIATVVAILLANVTNFPTLVARVGFDLVAAATIGSGVHYTWRVANRFPPRDAAAPPPDGRA